MCPPKSGAVGASSAPEVAVRGGDDVAPVVVETTRPLLSPVRMEPGYWAEFRLFWV